MTMSPFDVPLPSVARDISAEIEVACQEWERLVTLWAEFQQLWGERFRAATDSGHEPAALVRERLAYVEGLGIEPVLDRIARLRQTQTALCDLVVMAAAGATQGEITSHAERFFCGGDRDLEAWLLAGSLQDWIRHPVVGWVTDNDIRIRWHKLSRMAGHAAETDGLAAGRDGAAEESGRHTL